MLKNQGNSCLPRRASRDRKLFLSGASAFAVLAALPAHAQDEIAPADSAAVQDEDASDEVLVRGIRRSLQSAQDIKQNADTFVDAITAEDIGALPDRSVTEALQRVPGVVISRFAAADDPDHFSIEGQGVVVRGLTYVRSELNGRDTFSANNGRALSFSDVPPELLGSVQVFKNQTADLIEGGIAGSINLVTRKPFDQNGHLIAGSAEYNYSDFRDQGAPTFSGLVSNRWDTGIGEFGILLNGVFSQLETRSDGTQISSFQARDDLAPQTVWVPEGAVVRSQNYDRERIGYGGSAQWQNTERTILATFEFLRSESTTSWNEHVSEIATDNVGDTAFFFVPGTEFGFDGNDLLTHGTLSSPVGWRDDQFSSPRTPIYGLQSNNIFRGVEQEYMTQDISFNVKWSPSDRLHVNLDYQRIKSTVDNTDFGLWGSTFQDVALDLRGKIPTVTFLQPNETGPEGGPNAVDCSGGVGQNCPSYFDAPHDSFADPFNTFWRAAMDHFEESEGTENAFRADVEYDFDGDAGWLKSMRVGGRYAKRDQTTRFSTYNWGALSEIWGNGGPVWMDEVGAPEGVVDGYEWENFHRGKTVTPPAFPYFNLNPAQNYDAAADFADLVVSTWLNGGDPGGGSGGWYRLGERDGTVDGLYLPGEIADVTEKTWAGYVKFDYGFDDFLGSGMRLDGNFGVRYVRTDLGSAGAFQFPDAGADLPNVSGLPAVTDPDNPDFDPAFPDGIPNPNRCLSPIVDDGGAGPGMSQPGYTAPAFCNLSAEDQALYIAFANDGFENRGANHDYDVWLPSFNAKLEVGEGQLIRFAYSKSIARPDVGLLRNSVDISVLSQDDPRTPGGDPTPGGSGFFGFTANTGQPFLNPITSHNFDLSYEWYFADVGSLTLSAFYKIIDDIIVSGAGDVVIVNDDGVAVDNVYLRQPTNSPETGKIKGFELAYQQFYDFLPSPFDGVGTQFTYTFIDSTGVPSAGVNATSSAPGGDGSNDPLIDLAEFPLEGLSKHNINASLIYEKGPISTRVSYNWRSGYLVTARDVITPFYPIFQNSTGQLDGSFFYSITDNIKIGLQAANILNEITETESYIPASDGRRGARSFFENDRRVTVSLRASFN